MERSSLMKKSKPDLVDLILDLAIVNKSQKESIELYENALTREISHNKSLLEAHEQQKRYVDRLGEQYAGLSGLTLESLKTGNRAINQILDTVTDQ